MKRRDISIIGFVIIGVIFACVALGWWAGRTGAKHAEALQASSVAGIPAGTPPRIPIGERTRIYAGAEIAGPPMFTVLAGRVYRGETLKDPILTLEEAQVHAGGPDGPVLYKLEDNRVVQAGSGGATQFTQRDTELYYGEDPAAPVLFSFKGTRVYQGDPEQGRVLATANTVLSDPDLVKLLGIVMFMETVH